jgi:hypothetical protein
MEKQYFQMLVNNEKYGGNKEGRPHYWYIAVADCQLEQFMMDASVPLIHYNLTIQNHLPKKGPKSKKQPLTHLSGDELQLTTLHTVTMMLSGLVAFFLVANVVMSLSSQHKKTVHVALLWVAAAAALDAISSLCEILHLKVYQTDSIGSYALDAMACHFEAVCDSLLVLLLISIGAGRTLPSDAVTANPNASSMQRFSMDMSKPLGSLYSFNGAAVLGIGVISMHTILGRTYNDDFESYHDLEHLPGKILMSMRLVLGFLLLAATMQSRLKCDVQQLKAFYVKLAIFGFCWFQSLPLLTVVCNVFVPYYLRRSAIAISCALLQSSSFVILAWLVTAHTTAYHHFSHMTADSEPSLTDTLSYQQQGGSGSSGGKEAPSTWTIGKSKIRLD